MKTFASVVGGTFAIIFGSSFLLFALPGSFVQHPSQQGDAYWPAVACGPFAPGIYRLTVAGLVLVLAGVALELHATFPQSSDMPLGKCARLALFWGQVVLGSLALVGLLVVITLSTLGLD